MPALNFKKKFAPAIESGEKRQTIRKPRKDGRDPKPGDTLYLYTGMRTKACRKLMEVKVLSVHVITVADWGIIIDGHQLPRDLEQNFASRDGFSCMKDCRNFFAQHYGLPFTGKLICW